MQSTLKRLMKQHDKIIGHSRLFPRNNFLAGAPVFLLVHIKRVLWSRESAEFISKQVEEVVEMLKLAFNNESQQVDDR